MNKFCVFVLPLILYSNLGSAKVFISNSCWIEASQAAAATLDKDLTQSNDFKVNLIKPFQINSSLVYDTNPPSYEYIVLATVEGENPNTNEWSQKHYSVTVEVTFKPGDLGKIGSQLPCDKALTKTTKVVEEKIESERT
ncbi:MAG: hypothetical protein SGI74_05960 [Oligoflexia bacterium]|nr:hypothetical protein [Oligoflexia bacterium]